MTSDRSLPPWSHMQLLARIAPIRTATSRAGAYARVPSPSVRAVLEFHTRTTLCPHAGVLHSRDARSRWSSTLARCHSPECRRWLHPALKRCTASAAKLSCFTADHQWKPCSCIILGSYPSYMIYPQGKLPSWATTQASYIISAEGCTALGEAGKDVGRVLGPPIT